MGKINLFGPSKKSSNNDFNTKKKNKRLHKYQATNNLFENRLNEQKEEMRNLRTTLNNCENIINDNTNKMNTIHSNVNTNANNIKSIDNKISKFIDDNMYNGNAYDIDNKNFLIYCFDCRCFQECGININPQFAHCCWLVHLFGTVWNLFGTVWISTIR